VDSFYLTKSIAFQHSIKGFASHLPDLVFTLTDTTGLPILDAQGNKIQACGINGEIILPPLAYTIPGTYTYYLEMDDSALDARWQLDSESRYFITLLVTVDASGEQVAIQSSIPLFSHSLSASSKPPTLAASLNVRLIAPPNCILPCGQFKFALKNNSTHQVVATAKNSHNKNTGNNTLVQFPPLALGNGSHIFTLSQIQVPPRWKLDPHSYTVCAYVFNGIIEWKFPQGPPVFFAKVRKNPKI